MLGAMGLNAIRQTAQGEWPSERGAVEVVTGGEAVARRLARLRRGAAEEVCAMLTGRPWGLTERPWTGVPDDAGAVPHRTVVEHATAELGAHSGGLRVVDRIPAELVIADRGTALLPLASGTAESAALLVRSGPLLDALVDLFEDVWHEGRPPLPAAPGTTRAPAGPDAADLRILWLLLEGLTDASVAKQLGLGLRTVQRRVKGLMELAGVTTRLQLGRHAAEHGWTERR
ncbi:LuxR family transcriptional regulator [Streptomyces triculaminicus]|uniref:LuxR family transcriptional regulator n=1 Tax=Streptomyces triculaminicus TaxID=2816232 RepID=A0A939FQS9_9ACTN|nr:helix-turn-helix domain-containing protein [Streptomyces triculaminicus]MBO0655652.1 LuxR family transcriptional regulator [Streptomyces triculaminicus]